ncbi:phosphate transporter traffic facilitator1 [Wolffia australiana]
MEGSVKCAAWIYRRTEKQHYYGRKKNGTDRDWGTLVVMGRDGGRSSPSVLEIFTFQPKTLSLSESPVDNIVIEGVPLSIAVHPSGEEFVCSTTTGCLLFGLEDRDSSVKLVPKELSPLEVAGPQKCLAFSTDGLKFACGAEDGQLRIFDWPSLGVILSEPKAHKSFRDMDISLDSEFLCTTSTDGAARIWKTSDGTPVTPLTRNSDEKFECCRFSRDGRKPFLFCTVKKGDMILTTVWDISNWQKLGFKRLLGKPISSLSISLDGKYFALGSNDGDICVVEVSRMAVCHWSKKLHLGSRISAIDFCPSERVLLSTSNQWGANLTKLDVPADWKEWQIYMLLAGIFLISLVPFYFFYYHADGFWNLPQGRVDQRARSSLTENINTRDDHSAW